MHWPDILIPPWKSNPAATDEKLASLRDSVPFVLPPEYWELLRWSDGGEGPLGSVYFNLWPSDESVGLNQGYQISQFLPHLWVIGDDSSSFYAFEQTADQRVEAVRFSMGFMHPSSIDTRLSSLKAMLSQLKADELP